MSLLLKLYVEIKNKKIKESYIYFSFLNSIVTINVDGDMNMFSKLNYKSTLDKESSSIF